MQSVVRSPVAPTSATAAARPAAAPAAPVAPTAAVAAAAAARAPLMSSSGEAKPAPTPAPAKPVPTLVSAPLIATATGPTPPPPGTAAGFVEAAVAPEPTADQPRKRRVQEFTLAESTKRMRDETEQFARSENFLKFTRVSNKNAIGVAAVQYTIASGLAEDANHQSTLLLTPPPGLALVRGAYRYPSSGLTLLSPLTLASIGYLR